MLVCLLTGRSEAVQLPTTMSRTLARKLSANWTAAIYYSLSGNAEGAVDYFWRFKAA